jgi:hypothetical protein
MHTNRLAQEKSPYLLQHAHNPVDWHPWGEEAFAKARQEGKPIFLSVGYSTCHWCHVMEHESFEDDAVAGILNEHFVSIKVDREERPDVDRVYMAYVQAVTGGGGWPMSVWLTPDLRPFAGGTYYPPDDRWGRPGFKNVLRQIATAWRQDRDAIVASADNVTRHLQHATTVRTDGDVPPATSLLDAGYRQIKESYEPRYGGFGGPPKFPRPVALNFMLRHHARTGAADALAMSLFTLRKMADGGIHDHLGGGFHRYSVDNSWQVPHFEKMLYDQAQLACSYLEAYQITHDESFADVARDILEYVLRDMTGPDGNFYCSEDADSPVPGNPAHHAEGAFYVWERGEIEAELDEAAAAIFNSHYGVEPEGNVADDPQGEFHRKNILIARHSLAETGRKFGKPPAEIRDLLANACLRLRNVRDRRPHPFLDDKTLTAWNGLMISAFARAAQVLDEPRYLTAAQRAATFIETRLTDRVTGTLLRRHRAQESDIAGYADDYAYLIQGLIDLYEASFEFKWLQWAIALQKHQDALFWDPNEGGYFSTTGNDPSILLRMKEDYDGAEPSPNSIAALNLLRLSRMTDSPSFRDQADTIFSAMGERMQRAPATMPQMLVAFALQLDEPRHIVIAGRADAPDTQAMLRDVHSRFMPNKILLLADGGSGQQALAKHLAFIKDIVMVDGKATAHVCESYACQLPTNDTTELARILDAQLAVDVPLAGPGRRCKLP